MNLSERNEKLFYRVIGGNTGLRAPIRLHACSLDNLEELIPIVYTPTGRKKFYLLETR